MRIIDSCARPDARDGRLDIRGWLERMDGAAVERAVIAAPDQFVCVYNDEGNAQVLNAVRAHPDRLLGLAVANPWYGKRGAEALERALDGGLAGLYLNPGRQGFLLTEAILDPLIEVCARRRCAVYSYTGTPVFAMPFQLAELARRHPAVPFIMGHSSWTDFCSYDVVPAARQAPNILIDPSCVVGWLARGHIQALGHERVLFCSGFPKSRADLELRKLQGLGLSREQLAAILYGNAAALWRLPS